MAMHRSGRIEEAVRIYRRVLSRQPSHPGALHLLGLAAYQRGRLHEAEALIRQAIQRQPQQAEFHNHLGCVLAALGRLEAALTSYRQAIALAPHLADAHYNLGNALKRCGQLGAAMESYRRALHLQPDHAAAMQNMGNVLRDMGRPEEAEEWLCAAMRAQPASSGPLSNYLFNLNYYVDDPVRLRREHEAFAARFGGGAQPQRGRRNTLGRRLRVGYVSPDFCHHSVAYFIEPLLRHHDRSRWEVYCYANVAAPDGYTDRLRSLADVWRNIYGMRDADVIERIRRDKIDVLVDLAGHTSNHRLQLFAARCAPVQATYLGYPNTTGLATMDFRITDAWADPVGSACQYTETLQFLPSGFLCFSPPDDAPEVQCAPPAPRPVTFGCFNTMAKIRPQTLMQWCAILQRVPESRLFLKNNALDDPKVRDTLLAFFSKQGIAPERLRLSGRTPSQADHLALYGEVDIALDTFPYNGTTTTCEALWMGVPVVTQSGRVHASRVGKSLLTRVGLSEMVAADGKAYVEAAVLLARRTRLLRELRISLRGEVLRRLCDGPRHAAEMEEAYIDMLQQKGIAVARLDQGP